MKKLARIAGFNLIELMVTVVIVAILAAVAYPGYQNYARQARRSDGQAGIQLIANRLEKFHTYCNSYPSSLGATATTTALTTVWPASCPQVPLPIAAGLCPAGSVCTALSPQGHYQISIQVDNSSGACTSSTCVTAPPLTAPQLAACIAACGYTIIASPGDSVARTSIPRTGGATLTIPVAAGVSGRQRDDGVFVQDSRGIKDWDRNNDGTLSVAEQGKWK